METFVGGVVCVTAFAMFIAAVKVTFDVVQMLCF